MVHLLKWQVTGGGADHRLRNVTFAPKRRKVKEKIDFVAKFVTGFKRFWERARSGNDYTRAAIPLLVSLLDVAALSLDSPFAFCPGLRMSIPPLK